MDSSKPRFQKLKEDADKTDVPHGALRPNLYDYDLGIEGELTPKTQYIMKHPQTMYLDQAIKKQGLDRETLETEPGQKQLVELQRQAYHKALKNHLQVLQSQRGTGGIGVFSATNSKTLNTSKINGQVNMGRLMDLPESDPRRYDYVDGTAFRGNRGVLRFKEMHKNPEAFYPLLLDLAQSQLIEVDSGNATVHTLIVADSNFPELIEKKGQGCADCRHETAGSRICDPPAGINRRKGNTGRSVQRF